MGGRSRVLPWEIRFSAGVLPRLRSFGMEMRKSAEAIVTLAHEGEGPNEVNRTRLDYSMTDRGAEQPMEVSARDPKTFGGTERGREVVRQADTAWSGESRERLPVTMEEVLRRENMLKAYERVKGNKGAPGVDGLRVEDLAAYLREHWPTIREELLSGAYIPQAVRKVDIPKPGGRGMRTLGIPTVVDRLIQQALHQALQPHIDPGFSESSFGFRPGRSAHQAVDTARGYMEEGYRWVVDMDLEKFFDRVNHDIMMSRLARRIEDKHILLLIRRYLQAGMMEGGLVTQRSQGTPQGGPLSPLLSNILLDELDKELEKRGHRFVRYADDCNIYVQSKRAGERVLVSVERFLWNRLRLVVNREKSAVDRPWKRKFLGYTVTRHRQPRLKVAPESVQRFKEKVREHFRRGRGQSLARVIEELKPKMKGWVAYFGRAEVKRTFEELDFWIRRRLRAILWRQWKRPRTRAKEMVRRGLSPERAWKSAYNGHGPWWNASSSHMNHAIPTRVFRKLGLPSLLETHRQMQCSL